MKTPLDLQVFLKDILKLMVANGGVGGKESHAICFSPVFTLSQLQNFLDLNDVKIKKEERSMTNRRRRNGQPLINVKTKKKVISGIIGGKQDNYFIVKPSYSPPAITTPRETTEEQRSNANPRPQTILCMEGREGVGHRETQQEAFMTVQVCSVHLGCYNEIL